MEYICSVAYELMGTNGLNINNKQARLAWFDDSGMCMVGLRDAELNKLEGDNYSITDAETGKILILFNWKGFCYEMNPVLLEAIDKQDQLKNTTYVNGNSTIVFCNGEVEHHRDEWKYIPDRVAMIHDFDENTQVMLDKAYLKSFSNGYFQVWGEDDNQIYMYGIIDKGNLEIVPRPLDEPAYLASLTEEEQRESELFDKRYLKAYKKGDKKTLEKLVKDAEDFNKRLNKRASLER